ncbi:hypothetical protein [Streptomyces erythrochromogenes]|uniref:hypothetical protein n=1 Tax=Streptomyces erythrochromogenes TaxID=285574 RepID=UPI0036B3CCDB
MAVTTEHVRALADAYRKALDAGDVTLHSWIEQKILVAVVVKSATDQSDWLETRVPGGGELNDELEGLVAALGKHDVVGANLGSTKQWLRRQMVVLVGAMCAFVVWPTWAVIVAVWAGNIFLGAYTLGYWFWWLLGGLVVGVFWHGLRALFEIPKSIGARASEIFLAHVRPPLEIMRSHHGPVDKQSLNVPVVFELKCWAGVVLALSLMVYAAFAVQFALGFFASSRCGYPDRLTWTPKSCS